MSGIHAVTREITYTQVAKTMVTKPFQYTFVALFLGLIARQGHAQDAILKYPLSVAASENRIFVADRQLPGIWVIADSKATIYHQAAKKFGTPLNAVRCLAIDVEGNLLAGDSATRDIYRFDSQGVPTALTGSKIGIPMGIAISADGTIYVSDLELHRIVKVAADGVVSEFAKVKGPAGMSLDSDGNLYVASRAAERLVKISAEGTVLPVQGATDIRFAQDVAVDAAGRVLVTDGYGKSIWNFTGGAARIVQGKPLVHPVGISSSAAGTFLVDPRGAGILKLEGAVISSVLSE